MVSQNPRNRIRRIDPIHKWYRIDLIELWEYSRLLYFFVARDLRARYKHTAVGISWAILQPLISMILFTLFFNMLGGLPSDGTPYPLFSFSALTLWSLFSGCMIQASYSVIEQANLITKVYFPKLIIPIASMLSVLIDFFCAFIVLLMMMAWYGYEPSLRSTYIPFFLILALAAAMGIGLWFAALIVRFRDIAQIVPSIAQYWLMATPIAFPASLLPEPWKSLYGINPMAGAVEGFRWSLISTAQPPGPIIAVSSVTALALFVSGIIYFQYMEHTFADTV